MTTVGVSRHESEDTGTQLDETPHRHTVIPPTSQACTLSPPMDALVTHFAFHATAMGYAFVK